MDAIDAYAEGLQFRAIKVFDQGRRNDAVWQMLRDNIRASDLVVGDMEAQVAASRIGAERMQALIARMGLPLFRGGLRRDDGPVRTDDAPSDRRAAGWVLVEPRRRSTAFSTIPIRRVANCLWLRRVTQAG